MGLADLFKSKYERMSDLYEQAEKLYQRRKYAQALPMFRTVAEYGDKRAQSQYGYMLDKGEGTAADPAAALIWYEKAAKQGYRVAIANCANAYRQGDGTQKDEAKALAYYKQNIEHNANDGDSFFWYAYMLYEGQGTQPNYPEAFKWFEKAAQKGDNDALFYIGMCYYKGRGVQQDLKKAFGYFCQASEKGIRQAQFRCGWMLQHGEGGRHDLLAAIDYYKKAAGQGSLAAAFNIGDCYLELIPDAGILCAERYAKNALAAYTQAADMQGSEDNMAQARKKLRTLYDQPRYKKNGIPDVFKTIISPQQALAWMRKTAASDSDAAQAIPRLEKYVAEAAEKPTSAPPDRQAQAAVPAARPGGPRPAAPTRTAVPDAAPTAPDAPGADDYRAGVLARRAGDAQKARTCFEKAAAAGHTQAMVALARLVLEAPGEPDVKTAVAHYRAAAEAGLKAARLPLARLLLYAPGTGTIEKEEGFGWLEQAAEADDHEAQYLCGNCLLEGRGTGADPLRAGQWYQRAASFGHPGARAQFARMCRTRMRDMQPQDDHEDFAWRRQAEEWCAEAAEQGLPAAQFEYGHFLLDKPLRDEEALGWWLRAADAGHCEALKTCADVLLKNRKGIETDPAIRAYWQGRQQSKKDGGTQRAAERTAR